VRAHADGVGAGGAQPAVELHGEQRVGQLGLVAGLPPAVAMLTLRVIEPDRAHAVSRRVAVLARQSAAALRAAPLAAARAARQRRGPGSPGAAPVPDQAARSGTTEPADRALRSPATEMRRASTRAADARQQAKRDSR
jgi:hypothetical protein